MYIRIMQYRRTYTVHYLYDLYKSWSKAPLTTKRNESEERQANHKLVRTHTHTGVVHIVHVCIQGEREKTRESC